MIIIDGNFGEGGGQIVRTALALSTLTQQPFCVKNIRKGRPEPGIKMQHLNCITALQKLTGAKVEGAMLGSTELVFYPQPIKGKSLLVDIETAGSITLFLQSILLPCCFAEKPIKIEVIGGTDVAWSTPIDYYREVIVPHLNRWADIAVKLEKRGYYPKGNGKVTVRIKPRIARNEFETFEAFWKNLQQNGPKLNLARQENLIQIKGISHASKTLEDARVAERQAHAAQQVLASRHSCPISIRSEYADTSSSGSGITLWAVFSKKKDDVDVSNPIILGADHLGEKGLPAEQVGKSAATKLLDTIASGAAVDKHLADNLIPWMALFPPSEINTSSITPHTKTNIYTVQKFMPVKFAIEQNTIKSFL